MGKQAYKVVGPREYLGHAPGSVFEADLEPESEARAIGAGHLAKSTAQPKEAEATLTPAGAEATRDAEKTAAAKATADAKSKADADAAAEAAKKGQVS